MHKEPNHARKILVRPLLRKRRNHAGDLVPIVAANSVTNTIGLNAASGSAQSAPDDAFSSMLGVALQGSAPSDDKTRVSATQDKPSDSAAAGATSTDADNATDTETTGTPAMDPTLLQLLQTGTTPQAVAANAASNGDDGKTTVSPRPAVSLKPDAVLSGEAAVTPPPDASVSTFRANLAILNRPTLNSQPATAPISTVGGAPAKPDDHSDAAPPADPVLAQLLSLQQPAAQAAAAPAVQAKSDDTSASAVSDRVQLAADAAGAPASDVAASAILTGGATVKPAKPGADATDARGASDGEKSQAQGTTAAALADIGKAATRSFTDEKVSSAHALPLHVAAETPRNNSQPGNQQAGQQSPGNTATPQSAPAPESTQTAAASYAPAHVSAAPQPDASAAISTAAAATPAAPVAASATAQLPVQLQATAHAPATPDVNALAFTIAAKSEGGSRHFDIRLDPAELGRVDVRLTVDDAGKAQATLSVEKPQTLALLQKDQGHLERALKDAGFDLSQNGLNFSLKGQQQQSGGNASSSRGRQLAVRAIVAADQAATNLSLGSVASSDARLDIRV